MIELKIEYDQYVIVSDKQLPQMKRIKFNGSGSVHSQLDGLYTSPQKAIEAIEQFKSEADADKEKPTGRNKPIRKRANNRSKPASVPAGRDGAGAELHAGEDGGETSQAGA